MSSQKTYPLSRSPLYRMRNRKKLAELLCLEPSYFNKDHRYSYRHFSEPKPNGGERYFADPPDRLKEIQKRINKLLQRIETPEWVKSGKKGESYITNGMAHLSADYVRTMDISHFYDSVKRDAVYHLFRDTFKMVDDIATIMTNLVLDGYILPTGSPTSQLIAFWAYREMFEEIKESADRYNCYFTLYVDDMTFSSSDPIPYSLRNDVSGILHKYKLNAKRSKDNYYKKKDFKIVTGVGFFENKADVPNPKKKELVNLCRDYKVENTSLDIASAKGKMIAARQIKPGIFPSITFDEGHSD